MEATATYAGLHGGVGRQGLHALHDLVLARAARVEDVGHTPAAAVKSAGFASEVRALQHHRIEQC